MGSSPGRGIQPIFFERVRRKGKRRKDAHIHRIHKAWSEHGVEALWTGQKNILLSCPKMPRLHARSRLYELGVYIYVRSLSLPHLCFSSVFIDLRCRTMLLQVP